MAKTKRQIVEENSSAVDEVNISDVFGCFTGKTYDYDRVVINGNTGQIPYATLMGAVRCIGGSGVIVLRGDAIQLYGSYFNTALGEGKKKGDGIEYRI